ncbi:MAG: TauD/TfdA family dioxygenase [Gammaproteobacteria bacterium]|nr:TauD/TfdA family dioxygenase [Gammaproteobacteria bacterium]
MSSALLKLDIRPIAGSLGAEIHGLQLRDLSAEQFEAVRNALWEHNVIFFHDQNLSDDEHIEFARRFGPKFVHPIRQARDSESQIDEIMDTAEHPPGNDGWHTDVTWSPKPPDLAILRSIEIPPYGGDTMWANMYKVYDDLSDAMKNMLEGLTAMHNFAQSLPQRIIDMMGGQEIVDKVLEICPPIAHPLVIAHPQTGRKALYVNSAYVSHIIELPKKESRALLDFLYDHISSAHSRHCRFRWQLGSVAIWDEFATQHLAIADHGHLLSSEQSRVMRRIEVGGSTPSA